MLLVLAVANTVATAAEKVVVAIDETATARIRFAGERLLVSLQGAGYDACVIQSNVIPETKPIIVIGNVLKSNLLRGLIRSGAIDIPTNERAKESFVLISKEDMTVVAGSDDSGALYGYLE